jgi:hypothetical protein
MLTSALTLEVNGAIQDEKRRAYAAMIPALDDQVGRIVPL